MTRGGYTASYKRQQRDEDVFVGCCAVMSIPLGLLFFALQVLIVIVLYKWLIA